MNYDRSDDVNSHQLPLELSDELKQEAIVTRFDTEEQIIEFYRILLFYFLINSIDDQTINSIMKQKNSNDLQSHKTPGLLKDESRE